VISRDLPSSATAGVKQNPTQPGPAAADGGRDPLDPMTEAAPEAQVTAPEASRAADTSELKLVEGSGLTLAQSD
jgi:hypothetical protein